MYGVLSRFFQPQEFHWGSSFKGEITSRLHESYGGPVILHYVVHDLLASISYSDHDTLFIKCAASGFGAPD